MPCDYTGTFVNFMIVMVKILVLNNPPTPSIINKRLFGFKVRS